MLQLNLDNPIVVSPDIGGVVRARAIAKLLNDTDMAIIDKRRPRANVSQVMHIIGDVAGRDCVLVDDMIDTGGTLCKAAEALKERGAKRVFAYATHPIFSGNAANNLRNSVIDEVVVCDTIPLSDEIKSLPNVRTLTLSGMLVLKRFVVSATKNRSLPCSNTNRTRLKDPLRRVFFVCNIHLYDLCLLHLPFS